MAEQPPGQHGPAISAIVLAAGPSSRLGQPKQLVRIEGEPMVRRVTRRVLAVDPDEVLVVVGHRREEIIEALAGLPVRIVRNRRWSAGQSTSVRTAVSAISSASSAVIVVPCDQPHLDVGTLERMIDAYRRERPSIVVPVFEGRRGAPVVLDRGLFSELDGLRGDTGARQLFSQHADSLLEVPLESALPLLDIDTPEDLARLR